MSLIPIGLSIAEAAALDLLNPVIFRQRNIGGFVADVTIEEVHDDVLTITKNPVEQRAAVTDHSYKEPSSVIIKAGWSNSSPAAGGDPDYVNDTYQALLDLQSSRQPFDIITGKRSYSSMLMGRITVRTDEGTENVLALQVAATQIILVNTQTVSVPDAKMANPQSTGNVTNRGAVATTDGSAALTRVTIDGSGAAAP
jgi:hypothetical protein